jgi:CRP-like cAMP-binding protein
MTDRRKKALFILGELNNDDLDWIIQKARKEVLQPGMTLIYEGRQIDALYIVLQGNLSVLIDPEGNKELAQISSKTANYKTPTRYRVCLQILLWNFSLSLGPNARYGETFRIRSEYRRWRYSRGRCKSQSSAKFSISSSKI